MTSSTFRARLERQGLTVAEDEWDTLQSQAKDLAALIAYLDERLTFRGEPSNVFRLEENGPEAPSGDRIP